MALVEFYKQDHCLDHKRPYLGHSKGVARPNRERGGRKFQILQREKKRERRKEEEDPRRFKGFSKVHRLDLHHFPCIFLVFKVSVT